MSLSNLIRKERDAFFILDSDARRLMLVNLIYALAFPFIIIFGSAFVRRVTGGDNQLTVLYNWGFFGGLVVGYFLAGKLFQRGFGIRPVFASGVLVSVLPLTALMFYGRSVGYGVIAYGLLVGVGNGVYWSSRNFLTCLVTRDDNRNYFASLEQFIIIFCNALVPLIFGTLLLGGQIGEEAKMHAYRWTSVAVLVAMGVASAVILRSTFQTPKVGRFVFWRFGGRWNVQRMLTFCCGTVEAGFLVLMTLLILNVAGDESVLGKIEFTTALVSVASIYIVGRVSKPEHRWRIMLAGATSLLAGGTILILTVTNQSVVFASFTVAFLGVVAMKVCQVVADPMVHSSFRATFLSSVERAGKEESRDPYAFIMDNEYFMNGGRIFGGVVFLVLTHFISNLGALRFTFIVLAGIQLFSALLIHRLTKKTQPAKEAPVYEIGERL